MHFYLIDVVFEVAFLARAVWENHAPISVLNSADPFALVTAAVRPVHLAVALSFVVLILSFVNITTCPGKLAEAAFPIVYVVALVAVRLRSAPAAPLALAVFHTVLEVADVDGTISPGVLSLARGLSIFVLAGITIPADEDVRARAMLQRHVPFALVSVSIFPGVHTVAMRLRLEPLPDVAIIIEATPYSVALLEALDPLAVVDFAITPSVYAFPICLAHLKIAVVAISVGVAFEGLAVPQIFVPLALVLPAVLVLHNAAAVALPVEHLAHIQTRLELLLFEVGLLLKLLKVNFI